ncbi:glucose-inhibited division protein B [Halomonas sp. M4R5S39]|uniref:hypothetical protein n=1 Tax=Halomonas kalidii TaxID=3043293 RepID=UPI0024A9B451|nr:hypothetical protein [Halomonas kalidii]MDI5985499.1 glucose-inhibited division protein B [Halomonas kalidii]
MQSVRRRPFAWPRWWLAAASLALAACGDNDRLVEVPLPVLATNPEAHDGRRVVTEGVVRHFEDPLHYWIEDEDLHRVEVFPHEEIAPHLGDAVRVTGRFRFSTSEGRRLTLESVEPLDSGE